MNDWYSSPFGGRISQGELLFSCPVLVWSNQTNDLQETSPLTERILGQAIDLVVMTQACDLEHDKVRSVVLCPHSSITSYRVVWDRSVRKRNQNPTEKAWRKLLDDITGGLVWNLTLLNRFVGEPPMEARIVDFHEVFTLPRDFLEAFIDQVGTPRLGLNSPYREHLSQAFARYFMRVGLPTPVDRTENPI
jgi:hypothetical protein